MINEKENAAGYTTKSGYVIKTKKSKGEIDWCIVTIEYL